MILPFKDANGTTIAYVKQKMFKLVEEVSVFNDESKSQTNYFIKADKWLGIFYSCV